MKKTFFFILVAIILMVATSKLQQYTINGTVVEDRGSSIIVEDTTGHFWDVEVEAFTYREGDKVMLTMKDKGTTSRVDDEVISLKPIAE